jgi:asparagine synthase (glutamine-hydrolysing)
MCAIAGVLHRDGRGPPEAERVRHMLAAMAHRGPDERAVATLPGATLGCARLAVLDPAGGRQPMALRGGRAHMVFNGAILNFVELRAALEAAGESFAGSGDAEVLLRLLFLRGAPALRELDGMFALAYHDPRTGHTLLARDPHGVKPLYWTALPDRVLFASEARGLLAGLPGRPAPDRETLLEYLSFQWPVGEGTMFRGVRRLLPGHLVEMGPGFLREAPWWEPPPRDGPADRAATVEALRAELRASVARSLRSDRPVGAWLSGGLDSSLVATLAAAASGAPLPAFTGAYDEGPGFDERPHARAVAAAAGLVPREVVISAADAAEVLPLLAASLDEPMAGPGALGTFAVARAASREVTVLLGGQGADELFSGYARHLAAEFADALRAASGPVADARPLLALLPGLDALRGYEPLAAAAFAGDPILPAVEEALFRLVHRGAALQGVLREDWRRDLAHFRPRERFEALLPGPAYGGWRERAAEFERRTLLPALLHVEDRCTAAFGLEGRVPLLSSGVASIALRAPAGMLAGGGGLKPLLRAAAEGLVPPSVLARRDKMGFPVPLGRWARGPLRPFLRELLLSPEARRRGLFDPDRVAALLDAPSPDARGLWAAVALEGWFRSFVDR